MQDVDDPTLMCLIQVFESDEAYQAHRDSEHHRVWAELNSAGGWRDLSAAKTYRMNPITPAPVKNSQ
jgi:hypothetical protein